MAKRHDIQGDFSVRKGGVNKGSTSDWQEARKLAAEHNADSIIYMTPSGLTFEVGGFTGIPGSSPPEKVALSTTDRMNDIPVTARIEHGTGKLYWTVIGPRVLRGGRVDHNQASYYGTVELDGSSFNSWKGRGAAGDHAKVYLEELQYKLRGYYGATKPGHHPPADRPDIEHGKESTMAAKEEHHAPAPSHAAPALPDVDFENAKKEADNWARITGRQWVLVYRDRTRSYDAYDAETLRRVPITEPHRIVYLTSIGASAPHAGECACEDCIGHHTHGPPTKPEVVAVVPVETSKRGKHGKKLSAAESAPAVDTKPSGSCAPAARIVNDSRRYNACRFAAKKLGPIDTPVKVYELVASYLHKEDQEVVLVIPLTAQAELKGAPIEVFRGARTSVAVDVPLILRYVAVAAPVGWILCHNHPSGHAVPSAADRELTTRMKEVANLANLAMVDHVIIGAGELYSFEEGRRLVDDGGKWKAAALDEAPLKKRRRAS
jgi:hypothetical protein